MRSSRPAKSIWQAADRSLCLHHQRPLQHPHLHHRPRQRPFHTSPLCLRRTKHHNISQEEMKRIAAARLQHLASYTPEEKAQLAGRYNAEQMAAIEAAEEAISREDLANQAKIRQDYYIPDELSDFSRIHPTIDFRMDRIKGKDIGKDSFEDPRYIRNMAELQQRTHIKTPEEIMKEIGEAILTPTPEDMATAEKWETFQAPTEEEMHEFQDSLEPITQQELRAYERDDNDQSGALEGLDEAHLPPSESEVEQYLDTLTEAERKDLNARTQAELEQPLGPEDSLFAPDPLDEPGVLESERLTNEDAPDIDAMLRDDDHVVSASMAERIDRILSHYDPPNPSVAPEIPKINDPKVRWSSEATAETTGMADDETAEAYARLSKQIGQTIDEIKGYRVKTLVSHRVVNQTRMGKIQSMYYLVVAGNENGMLGLGEGKSAEAEEAVRAARLNAIRSMKPIRRYENRTIYGEVEAKVAATIVKLSARRPGFGLRVNQHVFEIARCAGLQDLACRVPRSRNKMNVAKAVWKALLSQPDPEEIAKGRGRKLVDVRKVYYAGLV